MSYEFEWDADGATGNHRKHRVSFDETSIFFADPLAMLMRDPDHSLNEKTPSRARHGGGGTPIGREPHGTATQDPDHQGTSGGTQREESI